MEQQLTDAMGMRVLDALPLPVAVLDADGTIRYLNPATTGDALTAPGPAARGALNGGAEAGGPREQPWPCPPCWQQALQRNHPCLFEERRGGSDPQRVLWVCAPLPPEPGAPGAGEVVLVGFDVTEWARTLAAQLQHALAERLVEDVQIPLISLVSLYGSLARDLTGEAGVRAARLDRDAQWMLHRLRTVLLELKPAGTAYPEAALLDVPPFTSVP